MSDKIKVSLTLLAITVIIVGALFWLDRNAAQTHTEALTSIQAGSVYSKGTITKIHYYKGKTLTVRYKVGSTEYEQIRNWDKNPKQLDKGDSIRIKYSTQDPSIVFTELEADY